MGSRSSFVFSYAGRRLFVLIEGPSISILGFLIASFDTGLFCFLSLAHSDYWKVEGEALKLNLSAWEIATDDFERFTTAHYLARQQNTVADKLESDIRALYFASKIEDESVRVVYPSLHLNIAKGFEDLKDYKNAKNHYQLAFSFINHLAMER